MTMDFEGWWKSVTAHRMTWSRKEVARYAWDAARQDAAARTLERDLAALRRVAEMQNDVLRVVVVEKHAELAAFKKNLGRLPLVMPEWLEQAHTVLREYEEVSK